MRQDYMDGLGASFSRMWHAYWLRCGSIIRHKMGIKLYHVYCACSPYTSNTERSLGSLPKDLPPPKDTSYLHVSELA